MRASQERFRYLPRRAYAPPTPVFAACNAACTTAEICAFAAEPRKPRAGKDKPLST